LDNGTDRFDAAPAGIGGLARVGLITAALIVEALLHWLYLPLLAQPRLFTIGGVAEIIIWLLLFGLLVAVQLRALPGRIAGLLTVGLAVWLVSQTADLMDEVLRQPLWLSTYGEDMARVAGMLMTALGVVGLIHYTARVMQELERLSYRDSLTGLSNRRMLARRTDEREDRGYSLLMLDLDHFKAVNDAFGHEGGDQALREIADVLRAEFDGSDDVFRLGGEEFAVLLEPRTDEALRRTAESLRRRIADYETTGGARMTVSIGAGTRRPDEQRGQLMRRVDRALYRAKDAGRDRVMLAE
jgi:diguanylate cyclase (GGDEF)-like protein